MKGILFVAALAFLLFKFGIDGILTFGALIVVLLGLWSIIKVFTN